LGGWIAICFFEAGGGAGEGESLFVGVGQLFEGSVSGVEMYQWN
jgi:hypothetical protein